MSNEMIDLAMAEKILRGDDTDPDILQSLGLELLAELKRMYESEDRLLELLQEIEYRYDVPVKQIAALMSI